MSKILKNIWNFSKYLNISKSKYPKIIKTYSMEIC